MIELEDQGMNVAHESLISFVKVKPFMYRGKRYRVKPLIFANMHEVNIEDYIRIFAPL